MSLAYALPYFCDVMLYFAALGFFGLLRGCLPSLMWVPPLLLAACWLSHRLARGKRRAWRYAPVAVALPCLLIAGNGAGRLASLPMLAYLPLYVFNNRRAPDYDYAADRFRHSLIAAGALLLYAALIQARTWQKGLPFLFMYFTLNMALLRLLRHDDAIARSRRFRILNLTGVAAVCAAGFALSQPAIVAALRAAGIWFAENVIINLLALVMYVVQLILYGGMWLLSRFINLDPTGADELSVPLLHEVSQPHLPGAIHQVQALPPAVRYILQGVGILLLALVTFAVLRALSRRVARTGLPTGTDERESLEEEAPRQPGGRGLRRTPEAGVRKQYLRALMLLRARGGRVAPTMNTLQIQHENADRADPEAMAELRALYLPVRYGERTASREDLRRAQAALDRMKKAP